MSASPQNYSSHRKFVPLYHFVLFLILLINLGWSIWHLIKTGISMASVLDLLLTFALLLIFFYLRTFALRVQDRIIRLEMRLRLQEVLPDDLKGRIGELTAGQLIGLRFAGDGELPGLVGDVLEGKLKGREEIKKQIRDWQPDHMRC